MESERLPRGADPKSQLQARPRVADRCRVGRSRAAADAARARGAGATTTSTLPALEAAQGAGLVTDEQADALRESWTLASQLRNAAVLYRGRPVDSVPSDLRVADGVSRILGGEPGVGAELAGRYRRAARHARAVTELNFYGLQ